MDLTLYEISLEKVKSILSKKEEVIYTIIFSKEFLM